MENALRVQRGAAYLAHRARCDVPFLTVAAGDLGDWEEAAHVFLFLSEQLLEMLAAHLGITPDELASRVALQAAALDSVGGTS